MSLFTEFQENPNMSKVWFYTDKNGDEKELFAIHGLQNRNKKVLSFFNTRVGLIDNTEEALGHIERHLQVFNYFGNHYCSSKLDLIGFLEFLERGKR